MIENPYIDDCFDSIDFLMNEEMGIEGMHDIYHLVGDDHEVMKQVEEVIMTMMQGIAITVASRIIGRFEGQESVDRFLTDVALSQMEHAENCEHCRGETQTD